MPSRALVAVNPHASRLHDPARRDRLLALVREGVRTRTGQDPEIDLSDDAAAMARTVRDAAHGGAPLVVAVGGDGTVRDVAMVLGGTEIPLGIVPVGTANLFAATIGIPQRPDRAAAVLATARTTHVDLGRARWGTTAGDASEPRIFVVAAGMGFDAHVMATTARDAKRRFGRYAYFGTAVRELRQVAGRPVRIEADGEVLDLDAIQVLVANAGELIPGLLRPAMRLDPDDGRLDVIVIEGVGVVHGVHGALEAIVRRDTGRSGSGRSHRLRAERIRVTGGPGDPVEVDGDVVGSGWLEAECLPGALRVLVPA